MVSLAAVLDGLNRVETTSIGGMDRRMRLDWCHRFIDHKPEDLLDELARPRLYRLTAAEAAELAAVFETDPDRAVQGVVR